MTFLDAIQKYSKKIAIIVNNKKITYEKLIKKSENLVKKIEKRSLVFILGGNNYETIAYYVGLVRSKSVIVLIDPNLNNLFLINLIKQYKPNYIILPNKKQKLSGYNKISNFLNYSALKKQNNNKINLHKDLAILLTTSGSTGSPKLVRQSYKNYIDNSKNIIQELKIDSNDSVITTLPISYTFGLSIINTYLISGSKIILNEKSILESDFWKLFNKVSPTSFYGVPFTYEILLKLKFRNLNNKNLKIFGQAGGKLNDDIFKKVVNFSLKNNIKFYSMYGQTEATARMSILNHKDAEKKIGSIGKPLKNGKFFIVNKNKKIVNKPFYKGELVFEGKNVCYGYSNNYLDLSHGNLNNFKLFTGDIAFFDKEKFFFIVGRKKRIIKIFGSRINLDEVENIIDKLGYKAICKQEDNILSIKVTKNKFNEKYLINKISELLNLNKSIIKLEKISRLPRNKMEKKLLNEQYK